MSESQKTSHFRIRDVNELNSAPEKTPLPKPHETDIPNLGSVVPKNEPRLIDTESKETKAKATDAISPTPAPASTVENTKKPLDTIPSVNIEDRNLPGNVGWISRIANATEGRWARLKTGVDTLPDRFRSSSLMRTEERATTKLQALAAQRQVQMMKKADAKAKLQEIRMAGTHWSSKIPFVRWVNTQRAAWERTKLEWAEGKIRNYDGQIKETNIFRDRAIKQRGIYDKNINVKVEKNEQRLNDKLRPIEGLRVETETAIERLSESAKAFAGIVENKKAAMQDLLKIRVQEPETETEAQERDALMEKINEQRIRAELLLKQVERKLERCYKHQRRIGRAQAVLIGAKERIEMRYTRKIKAISTAEDTQQPLQSAESDKEGTLSASSAIKALARAISGEESMEKALSPKQFIELWNRVAPGALIQKPESFSIWLRGGLEGIQKGSVSSKLAPTEEENILFEKIKKQDDISLKEWKIVIDRLIRISPEFKTHCARENLETNDDAFDLISMLVSALDE